MAENPKQYFIDDDTLAKVWVALFESDHEDLAQEVSANMIAQGCQELTSTLSFRQVRHRGFYFLSAQGRR